MVVNGRSAKGEVVLNRKEFTNILIGVLIGICLGIGGATLARQTRPAPIVIIPPAPTSTPAPTPTPAPIQVFVNGAVAKPDIYELPPESNVKKAIAAAGGFTENANTVVVNLAQPLSHGYQVYVPTIAESTIQSPPIVSKPEGLTTQSYANSGTETNGLVNINIATLDDLDTLPGIGPSIAQKIIDYRDANGSFPNAEAIMNVSGIGEAKYNQIKDLITTEGE
jgi:competence protein ComEA